MRNKHLSSRRGLTQQLRLATVLLCFRIIIQAIVNIISMPAGQLLGPNGTLGEGGGGGGRGRSCFNESLDDYLATYSRQLLPTSTLSIKTQKCYLDLTVGQ